MTDGKTAQPGTANVEGVTGGSIIGVLAGGPGAPTSMSSIDDIRVTDASIQLFDEANDAIWNIPKAQLAFRRMPSRRTCASR